LARYLALTPDQLGYTAENMFKTMLAQPASDAWWTLNNPIDAMTGQGRAANQILGVPIMGRFGAKTPGLRAEIAQKGDEYYNFSGEKEIMDQSWPDPRFRQYNLLNEDNKVVASANRNLQSRNLRHGIDREAYVPEMYVDPLYRDTTAMFDLYRLLSHQGKYPIKASFANADLAHVFRRKAARERGEPDPGSMLRYRRQRKGLAKKQRDAMHEGNFRDDFEDTELANAAPPRPISQSHGIPALRRATRPPAPAPRINPVPPMSFDQARQLQLALAMERAGRMRPRRREPVANAFLPPSLRVPVRPVGTRGGR
jgi:hypothetical protein